MRQVFYAATTPPRTLEDTRTSLASFSHRGPSGAETCFCRRDLQIIRRRTLIQLKLFVCSLPCLRRNSSRAPLALGAREGPHRWDRLDYGIWSLLPSHAGATRTSTGSQSSIACAHHFQPEPASRANASRHGVIIPGRIRVQVATALLRWSLRPNPFVYERQIH